MEVKKWLKDFGDCVRAKDFASGRRMFYSRIVCLGSHARLVTGLDSLIEKQWKKIWPNITGFDFGKMHFEFNHEKNMACVIGPWISTGYHKNGESFSRPGRVTILLIKDPVKKVWLAKHTHYSLFPGTPNKTFGPKNKST
jgi:hypothetical protein